MPSQKKYNSRFPPSRIKKIMQTDEDVGKVAAPVPVIISRVLEMFVRNILTDAANQAKEAQARTLQPAHLVRSICADQRFSFLYETISLHYKPGAGESATDEKDALKSIMTASAEASKVNQTSEVTTTTCTPPVSVDSAPLTVQPQPSSRLSQPSPGLSQPEQTGCIRPAAGAPRGRGRPRGRPPKRPAPDVGPLNTALGGEIKIKKPRGRPRSQPLSSSSIGKDLRVTTPQSCSSVAPAPHSVICAPPSAPVEGVLRFANSSSASPVPGLVRPSIFQHSSLPPNSLKVNPEISKYNTAPPSIPVPVISSAVSSTNGEMSVKKPNGGNPFFAGINISIPGLPSFSLPVQTDKKDVSEVQSQDKEDPVKISSITSGVSPVIKCTSVEANSLSSNKIGEVSVGMNPMASMGSISIAPTASTMDNSDEDYDA